MSDTCQPEWDLISFHISFLPGLTRLERGSSISYVGLDQFLGIRIELGYGVELIQINASK